MKYKASITILSIIILFLLDCLNAVSDEKNVFGNNSIIFISDIQEPLTLEKLWLEEYKNKEATEALIVDIPSIGSKNLFFLGDMVPTASNNSWENIDKHLNFIKKCGMSIFATPGNHEYMSLINNIKQFEIRFPDSNLDGYFHVIDSIAIVVVNSYGLNDKKNNTRIQTYSDWIKSLEKDKSIKLIIVATHYSPFTNSKIVDPSEEVQTKLLPDFFSSEKTKLFISGHSHNLEYFTKESKHFFVIGGGGGLHQGVLKKEKRKWHDMIEEDAKPLYFYVIVQRKGDNLKLIVRGIKKDFKFFEIPFELK